MTNLELVNLMMKSSDTNPYRGKLTRKENIVAAIELAEYVKTEFADEGHKDEAMDVPSEQWNMVILTLKSMLEQHRE